MTRAPGLRAAGGRQDVQTVDVRLRATPSRSVPLVSIPSGVRSPAEARRAGLAAGRTAAQPRIALEVPRDRTPDLHSAFIEALLHAAPGSLRSVDLLGARDEPALRRAVALGRAGAIARSLTNTPASVKTPPWLAARAHAALTPLGVEVDIRDEMWLDEHGFGGTLAVGAGSAVPPRLVEARWRPRRPARGHVVLVGKGITFDTGGLNIKAAESMRTMHTDMGGAAAVIGALLASAALDLPLRVTALLPTAQNSVSGSAMRPGDIVRHYGGRTTEVLNTDAEGRLVLADAMAYAVARLRPSVLVDIATLTGAMRVTLGTATAGLFATDDALAGELIAAGEASGEPLWRLPLVADYEHQLESPIADAQNAPGSPGGLTAALFLRPFAGGLPWGHVDIAGAARALTDDGPLPRGATGFGARLLAYWLEALSRLEP